jgi:hypothetical protein
MSPDRHFSKNAFAIKILYAFVVSVITQPIISPCFYYLCISSTYLHYLHYSSRSPLLPFTLISHYEARNIIKSYL